MTAPSLLYGRRGLLTGNIKMIGRIERKLKSNDAYRVCEGLLAVGAFPFHCDRGVVTTDGHDGFPTRMPEEEFYQRCFERARELDGVKVNG